MEHDIPDTTDGALVTGRPDYEGRRARRIDGLRGRADKLREEGEQRLASARRTSDMIPLGQPILVGHHSEKRQRRDLKRIHDNYDRGFRAINEAAKCESRASFAERNDAISSDDPNAPARIQAKIAALEAQVAQMKAANALIRKAKGDKEKAIASLVGIGFPQSIATKLMEPIPGFGVGFESFTLSNRGAEIRRLKHRLAGLANTAKEQAQDEEHGDMVIGAVTVRTANNRAQLLFPGKPSEGIRRELKANGFRWAPSEGAWQRLYTFLARREAIRIAKLFAENV